MTKSRKYSNSNFIIKYFSVYKVNLFKENIQICHLNLNLFQLIWVIMFLNLKQQKENLLIFSIEIINRISRTMTLSQSKLMIQLNKEQKITHRYSFNQDQIDQLYNNICKFQPKNLMLVEFLTLIIERDFIKNSNKLIFFADLYDEIKGKNLDAEHSYSKNNLQVEQHKFSKKKFTKMLKQLAKKIYPGNQNAYQTVLFQRLTRIDTEQHRIKIDESIRKMLSREAITTINDYDNELQTIFEVYMPQNYNSNLEFNWQEIKILDKKLPIICCLRFLYETELVPHFLSAVQFMEIVGKLKPPIMPNSNSSKEAMFYTSQTITTYLRDHISSPQIKLLEGDVGFTFFEFQIFLIRVATEFSKDSKHQYVNNIKKFANYTKLKEAFDELAPRRNKFMQLVKVYLKKKLGKNQSIIANKRQSKKKIEDLYDCKELESKQEQRSKSQYKNIGVEPKELQMIKKDLDGELPELPQKKKIQKENEGFFDVDKKHVVIGEQLPKIQEKSKTNAGKQNKKKTQDAMLGYKPQILKITQSSDALKVISRPKKLRVNTQFPIVLNQIFYPSDLKNQLFISPNAQVYLQTSYIHLGQRLYEQAFMSYVKAKTLNESKSSVTQFFYNIHAAQIFQSAGKDEVALSFYHRAKELVTMLTSIQGAARAQPYIGIGACLYHLDQFQLAYRCFQKARTLIGFNLQNESIENAILQNNIGCCLMMLNRNQEAIKYFQTSHTTFDQKVGVFDQRSLVVQQNAIKNRKAYLQLMPQFKTMWKTYIQKSTTKLPAVKPKQKK